MFTFLFEYVPISTRMDTIENILYRSISAIYESTVDVNAQYPFVYFFDNNKINMYYSFKLQSIHPTRLIVRRYQENKNITILDMVWLVDGVKFYKKGFATIIPKSSTISIEGEPQEYIENLNSDPLIKASISDLVKPKKFLEYVLISSIAQQSPKIISKTLIDLRRIPTSVYSVSRLRFEHKLLEQPKYFDDTLNCILATIDLIHQGIDVILQTKPTVKEEKYYCIRCGMAIPSGSYYCPYCGAKQ